NGLVQVQGVCRALPCESTQASQRHLDVARAQFRRIIQIAKLTPIPDLDRPAMARTTLANTHAFGIVTVCAEGRGARSADPFRTTLMAPRLLLQTVPERFHQLVPAAE